MLFSNIQSFAAISVFIFCFFSADGYHRRFGHSDYLPEYQRSTMEKAEQELHQIIDGFDPWRPQYAKYYADPNIYQRNFQAYANYPKMRPTLSVHKQLPEIKNNFGIPQKTDYNDVKSRKHHAAVSVKEKRSLKKDETTESPKVASVSQAIPNSEKKIIQRRQAVKMAKRPAYLPAIPRKIDTNSSSFLAHAEPDNNLEMELVPVEPYPLEEKEESNVVVAKRLDYPLGQIFLTEKKDSAENITNTLQLPKESKSVFVNKAPDHHKRKRAGQRKNFKRSQLLYDIRELYEKLLPGSTSSDRHKRKHGIGEYNEPVNPIPPTPAMEQPVEITSQSSKTSDSLSISKEFDSYSSSDTEEDSHPQRRPVNYDEPDSPDQSDDKSIEKHDEDKEKLNGNANEGDKLEEVTEAKTKLQSLALEGNNQTEIQERESSTQKTDQTTMNPVISTKSVTLKNNGRGRAIQKKTEDIKKTEEHKQKEFSLKKTGRSSIGLDRYFGTNHVQDGSMNQFITGFPSVANDFSKYIRKNSYRHQPQDYIPRYNNHYQYQPDYGSYLNQYPYGSTFNQHTLGPYMNQYPPPPYMNQYPPTPGSYMNHNFQQPTNFGPRFGPMIEQYPNQYGRSDENSQLLQDPNWYHTVNNLQQDEEFHTPNTFQGRRHRILFHNGKLSIIADGGDYAKG